METLAEYFDRTKGKTERSLRRLGHRGGGVVVASVVAWPLMSFCRI